MCVCVCVCVCVNAVTNSSINICLHVLFSLPFCAHFFVFVYAQTHSLFLYIRMQTQPYLCLYVCLLIHSYTHTLAQPAWAVEHIGCISAEA